MNIGKPSKQRSRRSLKAVFAGVIGVALKRNRIDRVQFRQRGRFDTNPATRLLREPDPCSARTGRVEQADPASTG